MSNPSLSVFTFTLNTNNINICSSMQKDSCNKNFKSKYKCSYCKKHNCYIPQFFKVLVDYIIDQDFDIVFIATQNDNFSDNTKLHYDYLEDYFKPFGHIIRYKTLSKEFFKKISNSNHKSIQNYKFLDNGLASSIFISHKIKQKFEILDQKYVKCNSVLNHSKGGLYTTLKINDNNSITFVNINLKSNMFTLTRNIHVNAILSKASKKIEKNHNLICCGSFNYDLISNNKFNTIIKKSEDDLSKSLKNKSISWKKNNIYETEYERGFTRSYKIPFYPTCLLNITRDANYNKKCNISNKTISEDKKYKEKIDKLKKKYDHLDSRQIKETSSSSKTIKSYRNIKKKISTSDRKNIQCITSDVKKCKGKHKTTGEEQYKKNKIKWCDRILYSDNNNSITCSEYKSYDFGQFIANSTHKAIYAHLKIKMY